MSKPNPIASLLDSRKTVVALGGLVLVGVVLLSAIVGVAGTWQERAAAIVAIGLVTSRFIAAIASEDVAKHEAFTAAIMDDVAEDVAKGAGLQ